MASARRPRTSFRPVIKSTEGGTDREEDAGEKSKQRVRTEIFIILLLATGSMYFVDCSCELK